jgi:hypothetical protein
MAPFVRIMIARMRWTLLIQAKRLDFMPGPLAFHDQLAPISAILAVLSGHWQPTLAASARRVLPLKLRAIGTTGSRVIDTSATQQ